MGFHTTASGADSLCAYFRPGHRIHVLRLRSALAHPQDWENVSISVNVPEQLILIRTAEGQLVAAHTHDAFQVDERRRLLRAATRHPDVDPRAPGAATPDSEDLLAGACGPVVGRWRYVWNRSAGILGLPADRSRHAGRTYVSLSPNPVETCALEHEESLARDFAELTARLQGMDAV